MTPEEEAQEKTRRAALEGLCRECGEKIEDPDLYVAHVMDHVRAHQAQTPRAA